MRRTAVINPFGPDAINSPLVNEDLHAPEYLVHTPIRGTVGSAMLFHFCSGVRVSIVVLAAFLGSAATAWGADLTSTGYRLRGGHVNAAGNSLLQSTAPIPRFSGSRVSVGQAEAIGFSGSTSDLESSATGFWPIVQGGLASLDFDGDVQA